MSSRDPDAPSDAPSAQHTPDASAAGPVAAEQAEAVQTAPDESAPDESAPDETAPGETAPGETAPGESALGETAPDESALGETAPDETAPDQTAPGEASTAGAAGRPATAWERFWFAPASAWSYRLAVLLVFGLAALVLASDRGPQLTELVTAAPERWRPVGIYLLLPQPRGEWLVVLWPVVAVACAVAAVANRPWMLRVTGPVAAYLVGFASNFGKVNHDRNVLVIALLALAVGAYRTGRLGERAGRFRWPVAAARSGIALMFLFAALSKLRGMGLDWVVSENMRNVLVMETTLLRDVPLPDLAGWIASEPWRWQLAALGALAGEGLLVVGVLARRTWVRVPLVVNGIGVLLGLNLLLDLGGWVPLALSVVLFDLDRLATLSGATRAVVAAVVLATGVAVATVSWIAAAGWIAVATAVLVLAHTGAGTTLALRPELLVADRT